MKNLTVGLVLEKYNARNMKDYYSNVFELNTIMDRELQKLSGGELQRFSLAVACMQKADIYIFDEPTSFLDVRQRLTAAKEIRRLAEEDEKYVLVVEHDLAILDLLSDYGCFI
ncbi:RNase L inhibitor [Enterocytozoon bieneusi H348]|nr:RNase L inhibitor [Enterocytozoon bieneusi H348]|eukprot:XP_002652467.1 RNase L inhibitor [Enterocytozoon bieneusi H348]